MYAWCTISILIAAPFCCPILFLSRDMRSCVCVCVRYFYHPIFVPLFGHPAKYSVMLLCTLIHSHICQAFAQLFFSEKKKHKIIRARYFTLVSKVNKH